MAGASPTKDCPKRKRTKKRGEAVLYEIIYDYDDGEFVQPNIVEEFEGDWFELQQYIRELRHQGCFHIDATCIDDRSSDREPKTEIRKREER